MQVSNKSKRILIVDGDDSIRKFLSLILTQSGYSVHACKNALEAMQAMEEEMFHAVVLETALPGISGFDLAEKIRANKILSSIPMMVVTQKREREDIKRAADLNITDYLVKPVDEHVFLEKVESLFKRYKTDHRRFELSLERTPFSCEISIKTQIIKISENGFVMRAPVPLSEEMEIGLRSQIFDETGIERPVLKLQECRATSSGYEIEFQFFGLPEEDLSRLRLWIQRKSLSPAVAHWQA